MTETQKEVIDSLEDAYTRYNKLVQDLIEAVDHEYISVYAMKKAILTTISESLHRVRK